LGGDSVPVAVIGPPTRRAPSAANRIAIEAIMGLRRRSLDGLDGTVGVAGFAADSVGVSIA
jgi:hypothetical protein